MPICCEAVINKAVPWKNVSLELSRKNVMKSYLSKSSEIVSVCLQYQVWIKFLLCCVRMVESLNCDIYGKSYI